MFFNGHEIGVKAVDKYENYHPVVWLTANDRAGAKNTGLSNDKIMCRITIKTENLAVSALASFLRQVQC